MLIPLVLHPDVLRFLRQQTLETNLRSAIWNCLQRLAEHQFVNALRVKKLKGLGKKVWEARIDRASRIVFTYEKSRRPETGAAQVYIAIQDICLDHDDVTRRAKARVRTPDVEWLDAEESEVIGSLELDIDSPESSTPASLEALQIEELHIPDNFTDEADELLSNVQWQVIESESEWQQAIVKQDIDFHLKLTPDEHELANLYGNLILSGTAGTGKTTVALYRLIRSLENLPAGKRLYVTCNPLLVKDAQQRFDDFKISNSVGSSYSFQFKTIKDLCLEILGTIGQVYANEYEVNYQLFEQVYCQQIYRYQPQTAYQPSLLWDEIRSIIKGAQLKTDVSHLAKKEYEELGRKRSSTIPLAERHKVYKLAEWYQSYLKRSGRFDEIDLVRNTLKLVKQKKWERYQLIVCDEVQDFTELHLELLMQLVPPRGHLLFAGDLHQMINPSGFRWEELKTRFFRKQQRVNHKTLKYNFRSVGALVNLANQLLKLRSQVLQEPVGDISQSSNIDNDCVRLVATSSDILKSTLKQLSPNEAILVRTNTDKEQFSKEFNSNFVFTIEEAKGLEFDTVFLVEFFEPKKELWDKALSGKVTLRQNEKTELRLEFNLLYVAITRVRRILNIWEVRPSTVWQQPELVGFVQSLDSSSVRRAWVEPSTEKWRERGFYYRDTGFYRQAIECFEKAGGTLLKLETQVKLFLQEHDYMKAAGVLIELQDWQQAAQLFEKMERWQQASECWIRVGNKEKQQISEILGLEAAKEWENAARRWSAIGRVEKAERCWLKSGNWQKQAEIRAVKFEQKGQLLKAAEHYELAGMLENAKKCRSASENCSRVNSPLKAIVTQSIGDIKRKGNGQIYGAAFEEKDQDIKRISDAKKYLFKGKSRYNLGDYNGAIEHYNQALNLKSGYDVVYYERGLAYYSLGEYNQAVKDYSQAIKLNPNFASVYHDRGVIRWELGNYEGAVEDFTQALQLNPNATRIYNSRGRALHSLENYKEALKDYNQALKLDPTNAVIYYNRGFLHFDLGDYQAAIENFSQGIQLNPNDAESYNARAVSRHKAGEYWPAIEDYDQALKLNPQNVKISYNRGSTYHQLKDYYSAIENYSQALKLEPKYVEAYNDRGNCRCHLGDYQGAIEDCNEALRLNSSFALSYYNRGYAYHQLGDYQGAIEDYTQALVFAPKHIEVYNNRGNSRKALGDKEGALNDYNQAILLDDNLAISYYNRGVVVYDLGNKQEAIQELQKAGWLYRNQGNIKAYEEALNLLHDWIMQRGGK